MFYCGRAEFYLHFGYKLINFRNEYEIKGLIDKYRINIKCFIQKRAANAIQGETEKIVDNEEKPGNRFVCSQIVQ